jgi:hypothetical protein
MSMDADQRERRKVYQRDYMRRRRSALKEQAKGTIAANSPKTAPERSTVATSSSRPETPTKSPESKPAKSGKPKSDRAQRREWRASVVEYLTDCLTDPACNLSGEWYERHRMGSMWLGFYDKLNQIEAIVDDKPDVLEELRLSIAIEALRRLSGEQPAGSIALPGAR